MALCLAIDVRGFLELGMASSSLELPVEVPFVLLILVPPAGLEALACLRIDAWGNTLCESALSLLRF